MCKSLEAASVSLRLCVVCSVVLTVVLSVIIAGLNVGVSSANNKMPTINFSTPEQPPGDTRRKVSGFLGTGSVSAAWS